MSCYVKSYPATQSYDEVSINQKFKQAIYECVYSFWTKLKPSITLHRFNFSRQSKVTSSREIKQDKVFIFKHDFFNSTRGGRQGHISTADEEGWEMVEQTLTIAAISCLNVLKWDKMAAWLNMLWVCTVFQRTLDKHVLFCLHRSLNNTERCFHVHVFFNNLNTSSVLFWRKKRLKLNACVGEEWLRNCFSMMKKTWLKWKCRPWPV